MGIVRGGWGLNRRGLAGMVTALAEWGKEMSGNPEVPSVVTALQEVGRWRTEELARHQAELSEVDQEVSSLQAAVANLQQQLEALSRFRGELVGKGGKVDAQVTERSYSAVFASLQGQAGALAERTGLVRQAEGDRRAAIAAAMNDSAISALLQEYSQFKTVEPTLAALPESYRTAIVAHNSTVRERLKSALGNLNRGPVEVDAAEHTVEVVYAVDAPEGNPELLVVVLPLPEEVHSDWANRNEDLQTWVAARVVQAVYQACRLAGLPAAQALYGGHQEMLAVEVDVVGARADLPDLLARTLGQVLSDAPELAAAKVRVVGQPVAIDYLLPPEEAEGNDEVKNAG